MLPKCVLAIPPPPPRDTLKLIQSRIQKWKDGDLSGLWSDITASVRGLRDRSVRSKSKLPSAESRRRSNATHGHRAVEDGQYRKALQSLTSMGLALPSSDVFNDMKAKHPCVDPSTIPAAPPPLPIVVSVEQVVGALRSFPAPGLPVSVPITSKRLCFNSVNHTLVCLTRVVNRLCAGKLPHAVIQHLCGASLLPCLVVYGRLWLGRCSADLLLSAPPMLCKFFPPKICCLHVCFPVLTVGFVVSVGLLFSKPHRGLLQDLIGTVGRYGWVKY